MSSLYLRWVLGQQQSNAAPRQTHRHEMVGGGVGGGILKERAEGGGVGGEVTVLKYMLLLLPHFQEWISVGSYG